MDVHNSSVSVCVRHRVRGGHVEVEEAVFGTMTQQREQLREWLKRRVRHVAMESTGVYWIPVWNVLESGRRKFELTLVNPIAVRALQGQKTDRIDARRIAEVLQYGLLRTSFIPPKDLRHLRELLRMRVHVQQDRNRVINRIAGLLETSRPKRPYRKTTKGRHRYNLKSGFSKEPNPTSENYRAHRQSLSRLS